MNQIGGQHIQSSDNKQHQISDRDVSLQNSNIHSEPCAAQSYLLIIEQQSIFPFRLKPFRVLNHGQVREMTRPHNPNHRQLIKLLAIASYASTNLPVGCCQAASFGFSLFQRFHGINDNGYFLRAGATCKLHLISQTLLADVFDRQDTVLAVLVWVLHHSLLSSFSHCLVQLARYSLHHRQARTLSVFLKSGRPIIDVAKRIQLVSIASLSASKLYLSFCLFFQTLKTPHRHLQTSSTVA